MILPFIFLSAAGVIACGFLGAAGMDAGQAASYVGGAMTLGGALAICGLFGWKARWHGVGGAAVVGLAGFGRNAGALLAVLQGTLGGTGVAAGELARAGMAGICLLVFGLAGRALLVERRRRQGIGSAR